METRVTGIWFATLVIAAALAVVGCESGKDPIASSDADSDSDTDTDTDSDSDSDGDSDSDTDSDCDEGELFCIGNDVYECVGPDNEHVLVEECIEPLVCVNGMCVSDDECGYALAYKSNVGCEYWAVDMDNNKPDKPYAIVVSNLDTVTDAHVVVEKKDDTGWVLLDEADIPSKEVNVFMLGDTTTEGSYHLPNQAFRVTSDQPVVAYQFNPYAGLTENNTDICTNDGTLLIPTSGMDRYYYTLSYETNAHDSSMNIIATEDGTEVKVTPASSIHSGIDVPSMAGGNEYVFVMNQADVLQLNSPYEISGTYVESDKPIAVFGGHVCAFVPDMVYYCDHLEHQMFPVTTWGQEFVAARSVLRTNSGPPESDFWRVLASEDGTLIETEPSIAGLDGTTLNAGQWVEVSSPESFTISAGAPIMVAQFLTGSTDTSYVYTSEPGGDPAMALLPPYEQFMTSYVFIAPDKYFEDYLVITHPVGLEVDLDDSPVSSNSDCATEEFSSDWEITRCMISDFTHTIDAAEGVGITVWGYGGRVSYGYTGGLDLETINPVEVE